MATLIREQYESCLQSITGHPLTKERPDERVSHFLNSLGITLSQVKNNHSIPYLDKIEQIIGLADRMSHEMVCKNLLQYILTSTWNRCG